MGIYTVISAIAMLVILQCRTFPQFFAIFFVWGIGISAQIPAVQNAVSWFMPKAQYPVASGLVMCFVNIGAVSGTIYLAVFEALGFTGPVSALVPCSIISVVLAVLSFIMFRAAKNKGLKDGIITAEDV